MAINFLEQLVAEWCAYRGYYVRRNLWVGKRIAGGYEGEIDVIAFDPRSRHLLHVETSNDADSWTERDARFSKKFDAGRKFIRREFEGLGLALDHPIDLVALLGYGSNRDRPSIAGGRLLIISDLIGEILCNPLVQNPAKSAVSEQFPLIRTLQFVSASGYKSSTEKSHRKLIPETAEQADHAA